MWEGACSRFTADDGSHALRGNSVRTLCVPATRSVYSGVPTRSVGTIRVFGGCTGVIASKLPPTIRHSACTCAATTFLPVVLDGSHALRGNPVRTLCVPVTRSVYSGVPTRSVGTIRVLSGCSGLFADRSAPTDLKRSPIPCRSCRAAEGCDAICLTHRHRSVALARQLLVSRLWRSPQLVRRMQNPRGRELARDSCWVFGRLPDVPASSRASSLPRFVIPPAPVRRPHFCRWCLMVPTLCVVTRCRRSASWRRGAWVRAGYSADAPTSSRASAFLPLAVCG